MNKWFKKFTLLSFIAYFVYLGKGMLVCVGALLRRKDKAWSNWLSFLGHMFLSVFLGMWPPMLLLSLTAFVPGMPPAVLNALFFVSIYIVGVLGAIILNRWNLKQI